MLTSSLLNSYISRRECGCHLELETNVSEDNEKFYNHGEGILNVFLLLLPIKASYWKPYLKCECATRRFQPGESPNRVLLRDCKT